ncbi:MAG: SprT family zinc-dependent metalloprotease [Bacteroidetes bacterium]|nr:SprT family zinc-dependent metalloprotease [Bacteroidota bacterium]
MEQLTLGDIIVDVELKDIKNVHLSVYPPNGRVRIAAPIRMNLDTIRIYALSKLSWIKKQQEKFRLQEREAPREYLTKEGHYLFGSRFLMKVLEHDSPPVVIIKHKTIELYVRPGTGADKRQTIIEDWYRGNLKEIVAPIITKWETTMNLNVGEFHIKKMRTKWGTCNREAKRIWLNLELAKKPVHCIEYIIVHEMAHLIEHTHNDKFIALMNHYLPEWRHLKNELNKLPISHREWGY